MDDVSNVMDAAQVGRAALVGDTEGGPMAMMFAASHPDRVSALVLVNTFARWRRADDYPMACRTRRRRSSSTATSSTTA
jgi:pimeloyl-ACP methyl ester carboxylesterase